MGENMKLGKALLTFRREIEAAIRQGKEIDSITAEHFEDNQFLICANNEHDDAEVTATIDREDLVKQLVEYIFTKEYGEVLTIHKLKNIPPLS